MVVSLPMGKASAYVLEHPELFGTVHRQKTFIEIQTLALNRVLQELSKHNFDLNNINVRQSNLDDLFLELTGKDLRN